MAFWGKGKRKVIADFKTKDIYKFYKDKYGDKAKDFSTFCRVWDRFIEVRMQMIIFDNLELYMPYRLGSLRVRIGNSIYKLNRDGEVDMKRIPIDWKRTVDEWMVLYPGKSLQEMKEIKNKPLIRILNEHSDGKKLFWFWDKFTSNVKNKTAYRLEVTRDWDRMLSNKVKKTKRLDYYE